MLQNKTLSLENENSKRFNEELEARNQTLIYSAHLYEEKWQKIYHAFEFYKEFYKKMKEGGIL